MKKLVNESLNEGRLGDNYQKLEEISAYCKNIIADQKVFFPTVTHLIHNTPISDNDEAYHIAQDILEIIGENF